IPDWSGGAPAYPHPQVAIATQHSAERRPRILRAISSRRAATRRGRAELFSWLTIFMHLANRKVCARAEHCLGKTCGQASENVPTCVSISIKVSYDDLTGAGLTEKRSSGNLLRPVADRLIVLY